jgi:hypothetical protein
MTPIYSKSVLMVYFAAASRYVRPAKFWSVVTPRHMERIMEHSGPMLKFSRVYSYGQTCMETLKSSCGDAQDGRNMGISIPKMLCH